MAKRFILTAQLQLAAPNNIRQVVQQINRGLQGITANVNINVQNVQRQLNTVQQNLKNTSRAARQATNDMEKFGEQAALAIRRYGAFTLATTGFIKLTNAISDGVNEAIKFDREMVRLSQVTGQSLGNLKGISDEITRLSKQFGVSSSQILEVSVTLAQAGLTAKDTKTALEAVAKTAVSATFGDIKDTTEAAIAAMAQFGYQAKDLEKILGSVNSVSAKYAVESEDIAVAIRRSGAAFKAAGGNLNEFQALFTSVRQTTRESAETIATGFRTIFTRLQRVRTQEFLKNLGINLRDLEGNFVGPYKAIQKISEALKDINSTDPRFAQIVEELGGFRQVSKVIPLIQQFGVAQEALNVAQRGGESLSKDAAEAQKALSVQIAKVKEEFLDLIRTLTNSSSFRGMIELTLKMTSSFIKLADTIQPLIPLISVFAAGRASQSAGAFFTGFKKNIAGFASGGLVPGQGNRDSVPAMLTPGEFVVRKKAVQAIGVQNLAGVNKYADGGDVSGPSYKQLAKYLYGASSRTDEDKLRKLKKESPEEYTRLVSRYNLSNPSSQPVSKSNSGNIVLGNLPPMLIPDYKDGSYGRQFNFTAKQIADAAKSVGGKQAVLDFLAQKGGIDNPTVSGQVDVHGLNPSVGESFNNIIQPGLIRLIDSALKKGGLDNSLINPKSPPPLDKLITSGALGSVKGILFEALIRRATNNVIAGEKNEAILDFAAGTPNLDKLFSGNPRTPAEAKKDAGPENIKSLINKAIRDRNNSGVQFFASGGSVSDTVPAMLTPGEFVINKKAAASLGSATLNRLNNADKIKGYAAGGLVGGAASAAANNPLIALGIIGTIQSLASGFIKTDTELGKMTDSIAQAVFQFSILNNVVKGASGSLPSTFQNIGLSSKFRKDASDTRSKSEMYRDFLNVGNKINLNATRRSQLVNPEDFAREQTGNVLRAKRISALSQSAGTFGAAGSIALGGYLSDVGSRRISEGNASGVGLSALGGAATGAGTGAAIGSIFGPVGAAVGALAGGIYGAVTAFEDAGKRLKAVQFDKELDKASDALKRFSEGKIGATTVGSDVAKAIETSFKRFGETSGDDRKNLVARFGQDVSSIEKYFQTVASSSKTFDEFNVKTKGLLAQFSLLSNLPFPTLKAQFEEQIKVQEEARKATVQATKAQNEYTKQLLAFNAFAAALASVSEKFVQFDANLSNINSQLSGNVASFSSRDTSGIFEAAKKGNGNPELVGRTAGQLAKPFGVVGEEQAKLAEETTRLLAELPQLVLKAQQQPTLEGGEQNFADKLETQLRQTKYSDTLITKLVSKIGSITTKSGSDQTFQVTDAIDVANQLSPAITEVLDVFKEFAPAFAQQAERIKNAFAIVEQAQLKSAGLYTEIQGKQRQRQDNFLAKFDINKSVEQGRLQDTQRVSSISGGATSLQDLRKQLFENQRIARENAAKAAESIDPEEIAKFASAQADANVAAQRAAAALRDVADSSIELETIQNKLAIAEQTRQSKLGFVDTLAFGGAKEKADLAKNIGNTAKAYKLGIQAVNPEDRAGIVNLLKSMPEEMKLFGSTAGDILKKLRGDVLGGNAGLAKVGVLKGSSLDEQTLRKQEDDILVKQQEALKILAENANKFGYDAAAQIGEQNKKFLDELRTVFLDKQTQADKATLEEFKTERNKADVGLKAFDAMAAQGPKANENIVGLIENRQNIAEVYRKISQIDANEKAGRAAVQIGKLTGTPAEKEEQVKNVARLAFKQAGIEDTSSIDTKMLTSTTYNPDRLKQDIENMINDEIVKQKKSLRDEQGKLSADYGKMLGYDQPRFNADKYGAETEATSKSTAEYYSKQRALINGSSREKLQKTRDEYDRRIKAKEQTGASIGGPDFGNVASNFQNSANTMLTAAQTMSAMPREFTMQANHKVEVIFNGAELLSQLQPEIQSMVIGKTKEVINNMIDVKFPDVGRIA